MPREASAKKPVAQKTTAVLKLTITTKGDEYYFVPDKLTAKAGQTVEISFKNAASPGSGLQHNWVLVKPGKIEDVSNAGIQAGADKGWIPEGNPDIIAHTKLTDAGKPDSITFKAPETPGDYPYVCTFPGHSTTMRGVLTVTK